MPYSIRLPDGRIVGNIPDDLDPVEAKARIVKSMPDLLKQEKQEQPEEKQSFLRSVADIPLSLQSGYTNTIRSQLGTFGLAGGKTDKFLKDVSEHLENLKSSGSKKDSEEAARIMKEAEDKGFGDQLLAAGKAFAKNPLENIASGAGSIAPQLIFGPFGKVAQAFGGASAGAGAVKNAIYDTVKEELSKNKKLTSEQVEARAKKAQEYFGENWDTISGGAALGALEGITGVNPAINRIIFNKATKRIGAEAAEAAAKGTYKGAIAKGAVKEATPEFLQGSEEQVAKNVALQREGIDTPTFRGAVSQGALEGLTGAALGAGTGSIELAQARARKQQLDAINEDLAQGPAAGSTESRVQQLAAQIQTQTGMDEKLAMMTAMQLVAEEDKATGKTVTTTEPKGKKGKKGKKAAAVAEATPEVPALGKPLLVFDTPEEAQKRVAVLQANRPNDQISMSETEDGKFAIFAKPKTATEPANAIPTEASTTTPSGTPDASTVAGSPALSDVGGGPQPGIEDAAPDQTGLGTSSSVAGRTAEGTGVQPSALAQVAPDQTSQITPDQVAATQQQEQQRTEQKAVYDEATSAFNSAQAAYDLALQSNDPKAVWAAADQYEAARQKLIESKKALGDTEAEQTEDQPSDPETATATSTLKTASDNVIDINEARKQKREKGKGEPASVRRSKRDAMAMLESATTGKSGLIPILEKLETRIAAAEAVIRTHIARTNDPTQPQDVQGDESIRPIEESIVRNRADYELGLMNLFEFASNPAFATEPSQKEALKYLSGLNEATKDRIYERVKRRADMEGAKPKSTKATTFEASINEITEDKQLRRADERMDEENKARAAGEATAPAGPAPTVTVKKTRKVVIPPRASAKRSTQTTTSTVTDDRFESYSGQSVVKALQHIQTTGNEFERALATRMLARDNIGSIKNTKFYVVNPKDTDIINNLGEDFDTANGLYVLGEVDSGAKKDFVFVRGSGFGTENDANGVNNVTVLHEALHASVNKRILYAIYAKQYGLPIDDKLAKNYEALNALLEKAKDRVRVMYQEAQANGTQLPSYFTKLFNGDAFQDVTEFVTYGMTDPDMQAFLRDEVEGVVSKTNGMDGFVRAILNMLGLDPTHMSGLRDLIEYTNNIAASVEVTPLDAAVAKEILDFDEVSNINDISKKVKKKQKTAAQQMAAIDLSNQTKSLEELGTIGNALRNPSDIGDYMRINFGDMSEGAMKAMLAILPTNEIVKMGVDQGIVSLQDIDTNVRALSTTRLRMLNKVQDVAVPWIKLDAKMQTKLANVMHLATINQYDPAVQKGGNPLLDGMYKQLDVDAKQIYKNVRDFYASNYAAYKVLLQQNVKDSGVEGDENDINTPKGRLAATIRNSFENEKIRGPYFPLMRYGDYWLSFGKKDNREFYMFESAGQRDLFLKQRMAQLNRKGDKRTFEQMIVDKDVDIGNDANGMRKKVINSNEGLKQILELIENTDNLGDEATKKEMKDRVYQLHLMSLPDQSLRKQFIHRKDNGVAGFSGDALRNFINVGTRMAGQLARVQHGTKITNAISGANEAIKGNPDKAKLENIVREVSTRAEAELNPPITDSLAEKLANTANKVSFLYLLTSAKSAANQMFGLLNFTFPTLWSRHGLIPTLNEMRKYMFLGYGQLGVTKVDAKGNTTWHAPSIALSVTSPAEKAAVMRMQELGIADMTRTYDLYGRKGAPSANYNDTFNKVTGMMGALFHHGERLSREITFMSSFRLSYAKTKDLEGSIQQAIKDTNDALFDYSGWNRPRVLRSPAARVIAQFKQFPMFVTLYLARNGYNMIKANSTGKERKEAAIMLFGTLGMTGLMAGAAGSVGFSTVMGVCQAIRNMARDDDEEWPLEEEDFESWFRNIYLPKVFGDATFMGMNLAELIDSGILNTATGYDVSSGISLNNMWFHDTPDARNWKDGFDKFLVGLQGPAVGVAKQAFSSIDDFNAGDNLKGAEKLTPAFAKGAVTALRYATEGALTRDKDPIKEKEDFTNAQLFAQALGYRTTGLAQVMNNNFAIEQQKQKLERTRGELMTKLNNAVEAGDDDKVDAIIEKIDAFSDRYPTYEIKEKDITNSLKARDKRAANTERGLYLDRRSEDFEALIERARRTLEEEERAARDR